MPTTLQFKRYNTAVTATTTGANGELTIDVTKNTVVVHDGTTAGGYALIRDNGTANSLTLSSNLAVGNISLTGNIVSINVTNNVAANIVSDQFGNLRKVPQSGSDKATSYTLAANDVGRFIGITTSGSITVPNSVFTSGDVVSLYNNTSGNIVMTMQTAAAFVTGNNTTRTTINISTRGIATVLYTNANACIVTGSVV
jgi:hypothetical protein